MQNIIIVSFAILACVCLVQGNSSSPSVVPPVSSHTPQAENSTSTSASPTTASTASTATTEPTTTTDAAISVKAFGGLVVSLFVIALL